MASKHVPTTTSPSASSSSVTVNLAAHPPSTPLGVLLAPAASSHPPSEPSASRVTIIAGWERLPSPSSTNHRLGPIQRSGRVRLGDRLVKINGVDVTGMTFRDVMDLLKGMVYGGGAKLRSMSFAPLDRSGAGSGGGAAWRSGGDHEEASTSGWAIERQTSLSSERGGLGDDRGRLYVFRSSVRRARVQSTNKDDDDNQSAKTASVSKGRWGGAAEGPPSHRDEFIEYEIVCNLLIRFRAMGGGSAQSYRIGSEGDEKSWSVWKRYSEFKALDEKLRASYGWQINALNDGKGLVFPPTHLLCSVFGGSMDPAFVERRREELDCYWHSIQSIDEIIDFANPNSHRYSRDLASFLSVEEQVRTMVNPARKDAGEPHTKHPENADGITSDWAGHRSGSGLRPRRMSSSSLSSRSPPSDDDAIETDRDGGTLSIHPTVDGGMAAASMQGEVIMGATTPVGSSRAAGRRRKKRIPGAAKSAFQRRAIHAASDPASAPAMPS